MAAKVTADPNTRLLEFTEAPVNGVATINVRRDLYSALKDDWHTDAVLQRMAFPFRTFGDPARPGEQIGPFVFFDNRTGWRLLPFDADHELELVGADLITESDVEGSVFATYAPRPGRTIYLKTRLSAQSRLLETGVSGLTPTESTQLTQAHAELTNIEGGWGLARMQRIMFSGIAAMASGFVLGQASTVRFRDRANQKDRITADTDAAGNRTNMIYDPD